jgi:predicted phage baseplate assembly protein
LLNTTMASQTKTTVQEVLGSSNGKPGQIFRAARSPILEGQILEVLEPSVPSSAEREVIERNEGADAIKEVPGTIATSQAHAQVPAQALTQTPTQAWVRWHEMNNFEGSGPRDRHYVVDRPTGEVRFGDGVNGMAPPALTGNIRMARYQTGGGTAGNKPAGSIVQIKTTVPYVEGVKNFEPADGGSDAEVPEDVLERETHRIRHRGRAVTAEDFEDLALLASGEVARALCIPLRDLHADRMANEPRPGVISLVLVPRCAVGATIPPAPSAELFASVRTYLDSRRFTGAKLVLTGPEYLRIHVEVEVTVADMDTASDVQLAVTRALPRYLNPLTGFKGAGWGFGKVPHKSDLYAFIEAVPGVEHVRSLEMRTIGDLPDTMKTGRFLVAAGDVQVVTSLEK